MNWFALAFTSALLSAAAAVTQKKVLFDVDALDFSFSVSVVTLLLSFPLFFFIDFESVSSEALWVLLAKNFLGALAFYCVMQSIRNLELSGALPMMTLTPGIVALAAWPLLGEALRGSEIAGMAMLLLGTYTLEMHHNRTPWQPFTIFLQSRRHHYIIAALLLFTATSILDKLLLTDLALGPVPLMAFQHVFIAMYFLLFMIIRRRPLGVIGRMPRSAILWILAIGIFTLGYRFAQIEAVRIAPVALVLSVKRISVFIASMAGGRLFEESYLPRKAVAILLLLTGAALIVGM